MDKRLFDLVHQRTPKFNDRIAEGYAVKAMRFVEDSVNRYFETAAAEFPPELTYEGYDRRTPFEEYNEVTKRITKQQSNTTRSTFELAPSWLYMVVYKFKFNGEDMELRPLYLPFVGQAGTIVLRGSTFSICPVAADNGFSVGPDNLYIPLNKLKLTFKRIPHHFLKDGERETAQVVWARVHQASPPKGFRMMVQGHTTIPHYIFAEYGVREAFRRYLGAEVDVGDPLAINENTHPASEWIICSTQHSAMLRPRGVKDKAYVASNIRLAIRKEHYNLTAREMIGGFFYVVDHFPDRVLPDYVDQPRLWANLIGSFLFGTSKSEGKIAEEMMHHMASVRGYTDAESRLSFQTAGIEAETIHDFFFHVVESFNQRITQSQSDVSSLYGKRLMVLYYVLKDIREAINSFTLKVVSPRKKPLTKKDMEKMLRDYIKPLLIMGLNKEHVEVNSVAVPGDNMIPKITSQMALQTDTRMGRGRGGGSVNDATKHLHVSVAEVGSYSTMNKSDATGRRKINPFAKTDENDTIIRNPALVEMLDEVQGKIQRRQ